MTNPASNQSMALKANIYEAKARLSELVERAENGEEVIIAKAGKPRVRLVPVEPQAEPKKRVLGQNLLGVTYIASNAFDPLTDEELKEWGL